jgi:hypothetical protein
MGALTGYRQSCGVLEEEIRIRMPTLSDGRESDLYASRSPVFPVFMALINKTFMYLCLAAQRQTTHNVTS